MDAASLIQSFAISMLLGLLVGLQRERTEAGGDDHEHRIENAVRADDARHDFPPRALLHESVERHDEQAAEQSDQAADEILHVRLMPEAPDPGQRFWIAGAASP